MIIILHNFGFKSYSSEPETSFKEIEKKNPRSTLTTKPVGNVIQSSKPHTRLLINMMVSRRFVLSEIVHFVVKNVSNFRFGDF